MCDKLIILFYSTSVMCKTTDCIVGCSGWCHCNYRCFECNISKTYHALSEDLDHLIKINEVRNKYCCFKCEHIWKSPVSKYLRFAQHPENHDYIPNYNKAKTRDEKDTLLMNYTFVYECKESKCPKCRQSGLLVGRNFRHCKSKKEWVKLKQDVDTGSVDLITDFHDYPKSLRKNS